MGNKVESKFEKLFGYHPDSIEPRLTGTQIQRMITEAERAGPRQDPFVKSQPVKYSLVAVHETLEEPDIVLQRTYQDGRSELAILCGKNAILPENIPTSVPDTHWIPKAKFQDYQEFPRNGTIFEQSKDISH